MTAKELKSILNLNHVKIIVKSLNGVIYDENEEFIILNTICHGGNSNKLYLYKDSLSFYCYSHCGSLDILTLVAEVKEFTLPESINYICKLLKLSDNSEGFHKAGEVADIVQDWDFISKYLTKKSNSCIVDKSTPILNKNKLNMFQDLYHSDWINDGIDEFIMKHFNIKYSAIRQSIIIPHYDENCNLIGIRQRALDSNDISKYGKYTPYNIGDEMYNHPLSSNFYGIHMNKETIKRTKKVMIVESEKSTLQCSSFFGIDLNFSLALCGSAKISKKQINILLSLGVSEVMIALDKEYRDISSPEFIEWRNHITEKFINVLTPYFKVFIIWDKDNELDYKDSPTDKGKHTLLKLMKNKTQVG